MKVRIREAQLADHHLLNGLYAQLQPDDAALTSGSDLREFSR